MHENIMGQSSMNFLSQIRDWVKPFVGLCFTDRVNEYSIQEEEKHVSQWAHSWVLQGKKIEC